MRAGRRAERAGSVGVTTPRRLRGREGSMTGGPRHGPPPIRFPGMTPPGSLLGNAVRRVEDPEVLHGRARYVDDLDIPGVLHLAFVRSTVPHAELRSVDVAEAA